MFGFDLLVLILSSIVLLLVISWLTIPRFMARGLPFLGQRYDDVSRVSQLVAQAAEDKVENPKRARKRYARIISGIQRAKAPAPDLLRLLGQALLAMGDLDRAAGHTQDALINYRQCVGIVDLPSEILGLVAADDARKKDASPEALAAYATYLASIGRGVSRADDVIEILSRWIDDSTTCDAADLTSIVTVARHLATVTPDFDWVHYGLGIALKRIGNRQEAISALREAERLSSSRASTPFHLGELYLSEGQLPLAIQELERSLAIQPDQPNVLAAMAKALMATSTATEPADSPSLDRAADFVDRACRLDPHSAVPWQLLSEVEKLRGNVTRARDALAKYAGLAPNDISSLLELADMSSSLNDGDAAISYLRQAIKIDAHLVDAQLCLARLLKDAGEPSAAAEHFRTALSIDSDQEEARVGLGLCMHDLKLWHEAIAQLQLVPCLGRDGTVALAVSYCQTGNPSEAVRACTEWLAREGSDRDVHLVLARSYAYSGDWSNALAVFTRVRDAGQGQSLCGDESDYWIGTCFLNMHDLEAAQTAYDAAGIRSESADLAYARGVLAVRRGRLTDALESFTQALNLDEGYDAPACFGLGLIAERSGDHSTAVGYYTRGLHLNSSWTQGTLRLGIAHAKAQQWADAVQTIQDARNRGMETDESLSFMALAQAKTEQLDEAAREWERLRFRVPDPSFIVSSLATTYGIQGRQCLEAGKNEEAISLCTKSLGLRPGLEWVNETLQESLARQGLQRLMKALTADKDLLPEAVLCLRREAQGNPENERLRFYLAIGELGLGHAAASRDILAPLAQSAPDYPGYNYCLALAMQSNGELAAAIPLLEGLPASVEPYASVALGNASLESQSWAEASGAFASALGWMMK